jgi:tetratricopeptide (TPR) repeat protein
MYGLQSTGYRSKPRNSLTHAELCPIIDVRDGLVVASSWMSEPLRTDPADLASLSEADRAARIEQLLLSGLDHYFGGHYEQAINIWTRVAFLERGHGRARAYIERARAALAERQRESDELSHRGVAAYEAGDLQAARELLTRAVEQGGPNDTALLFLERLNRVDVVSGAARGPEAPRNRSRAPRRERPYPSADRAAWLSTAVASIVMVGVIVLAALATRSWLAELPVSAPMGEPVQAEALPIVRPSDTRLSRARELSSNGRAHDALRLLSDIDLADPLRGEADQLTSDIQRGLLAGMAGTPATAPVGETPR